MWWHEYNKWINMPRVVDDTEHMTPSNAESRQPKPSALPGPTQAPEPVIDFRRLYSTYFWKKGGSPYKRLVGMQWDVQALQSEDLSVPHFALLFKCRELGRTDNIKQTLFPYLTIYMKTIFVTNDLYKTIVVLLWLCCMIGEQNVS